MVIDPDYASKTGQSARIIGYAPSIETVLAVIVVTDQGHEYGASRWRANGKDRNIYYRKGA